MVGGHQPHRRRRRLPVRHRRPPVLHEGARGRGAVARDPPRRGLPAAARGRAASTTRASSSTTRSRPSRRCARSASIEAIRCGLSFLWVRVRPPKDQTTLEGYVVANYGWRLYGHFFKAYSTKVWAVPPSEISAEWGAQRIKGMTLWSAVWEPVPGPLRRQAGQEPAGHQPHRGVPVPEARARDDVGALPRRSSRPRAPRWCSTRRSRKITHADGRATAVVAGGSTYDADHVISSMPFNGLLKRHGPAGARRGAARGRRPRVPRLPVGRPGRPRREGGLDRQLDLHPRSRDQDHARAELRLLVAVHGEGRPQRPRPRVHGERGRRVVDRVRRGARREGQGRARGARAHAGRRRGDGLRGADAEGVPGLRRDLPGRTSRCSARGWRSTPPTCTPSGRNGMHRYNNQDHSMYTAMLTVENLYGAAHDIWDVNVEEEYHEESSATASRAARAATPRSSRRRDPLRRLSASGAAGAARGRGSPHQVTSSIASTTIRPDIFDVPRTRSLNVIGTSVIAPPTRAHPVGHLDLERVAVGAGGLVVDGLEHVGAVGAEAGGGVAAPAARARARRSGCPTARASSRCHGQFGVRTPGDVAGADRQRRPRPPPPASRRGRSAGSWLTGRRPSREHVVTHRRCRARTRPGTRSPAPPCWVDAAPPPAPTSAPPRSARSAVPSGLPSSTTRTDTVGAAARTRWSTTAMFSASWYVGITTRGRTGSVTSVTLVSAVGRPGVP